MKKAFTLIELLVVVLIIGILSAIALPQYQKAVEKTRIAQLVILATSVKNAQEEFYLANNNYTDDWNNLSISLNGTINGNTLTNNNGPYFKLNSYDGKGSYNAVYAYDSRLPNNFLIFRYNYSGGGVDTDATRACYATKTNVKANDLCKTISGKNNYSYDAGSWYAYYFHK